MMMTMIMIMIMRNEMLIELPGNSEKIQAPDGIRTLDPP